MEKEKKDEIEETKIEVKSKNKDTKGLQKEIKELIEKINLLQAELEKNREKLNSTLEGAARYNDAARYYKNEYDRLVKYRSQALAENLMPVLDSFQYAFQTKATTPEMENYQKGFQYVAKMLIDALAAENIIQIIPKVGEKFNANIHNAVESIETEELTLVDTIASVRVNGYLLVDRLIRPANVVVYIKKVEKNQEEVEEEVKEEAIEA